MIRPIGDIAVRLLINVLIKPITQKYRIFVIRTMYPEHIPGKTKGSYSIKNSRLDNNSVKIFWNIEKRPRLNAR